MQSQAQKLWRAVSGLAPSRIGTLLTRARLAFLVALWSWCGITSEATGQTAAEYNLKAALLYNFLQFVEWPPEKFPKPDSPWVIGVLGRDPFGKGLDDIAGSETHRGHPIVVERYRNLAAMRECHILFVSESEADNLPSILAALKGRAILTVGDFEGFAVRGGMVRFGKSPEEKIRLRINLQAVRDANLTMSAKLLRLAEVLPLRSEK